jgi:hypothetical protein
MPHQILFDKIKMNEMSRACSMYKEEGHIQGLVGKPERKRLLGRCRHRWEDNVKMDLQEVGSGRMNWLKLAQDKDRWRALVNAVMNLHVT